jgi:hypothetical protein
MGKEWIALIGVFFGAIITGLLSYINACSVNKREKKEKERQRRIDCLEKIIEGADSANNSLSYFYTNISVSIFSKEPDALKNLKVPDFPITRLELNIRLRFPSLVLGFEELVQCKEVCSDTLIQALQAYATGGPSASLPQVKRLMEEVKKFGDACSKLKNQAIELGRKEIGR